MKKEVVKEHWPRLLKNSGKYNWLKADWSKWVDEDEEDAKPDFDGLGKYQNTSCSDRDATSRAKCYSRLFLYSFLYLSIIYFNFINRHIGGATSAATSFRN
jgi:hypothetical protein